MKKMFWAAASLALFSGLAQAGQSAMHCLSVTRDGDRTYFKNTCNKEITVAMCSKNKKIVGKLCNEQGSSWNPYYTQMFNLKAGEKTYKYQVGNVNYAACMGFINGWDAKGKFSSDRSGGFKCLN